MLARFFSFGSESTASKILIAIKNMQCKTLDTIEEEKEMRSLLAKAIEQALASHGLTYKDYQQMTDAAKKAIRTAIAEALFKKANAYDNYYFDKTYDGSLMTMNSKVKVKGIALDEECHGWDGNGGPTEYTLIRFPRGLFQNVETLTSEISKALIELSLVSFKKLVKENKLSHSLFGIKDLTDIMAGYLEEKEISTIHSQVSSSSSAR